MRLNEYQKAAAVTMLCPKRYRTEYCAFGLLSEAGEVADVIKKCIRSETNLYHGSDKLADELGDVLWYVAMLAESLGFTLDDIAARNLKKLAARKAIGELLER